MKINNFSPFYAAISQTPPVTSYGYITFSGNVSGESIAYQNAFQTIQNVLNPVLVYVNYASGENEDGYVCLNSHQGTFPVSGVNLPNSCPNGGFGIVSNTTAATSTQLYKRSRILSKERANHFAKLVEEATDSLNAYVYVKPSSDAGFVFTVPGLADGTDVNFNLYVTATYCEDPTLYPIGSENSCLPITDVTTSVSASIPANTWTFYRYTAPSLDTSVLNSFAFYQNNTKNIDMFVQSGYIPTSTWYLETTLEEDDDGGEFQYVYTPSRFTAGSNEIFFVGLYNNDDSNDQAVYLNVTLQSCSSSGNFSVDCQVNTGNGTNPVYGVVPLSANISSPSSSANFDASDAESYADAFAFYEIVDLPTDIGDNYYVRVSVGNNNLGKFDFPPALYAKLNGFPSLQSYDYNISNTDSTVANQLSLPITDPLTDTWYVMVALPAYYTIWVGDNCFNNCGGGDGSCTCSLGGAAVPCNFTSADNETIADYFTIPTNLGDASGVCSCSENSYSKSFDCSSKPNYHIPYLVLLLLIGLVITAVAIAVPIYRYVKRHKPNYDPLL